MRKGQPWGGLGYGRRCAPPVLSERCQPQLRSANNTSNFTSSTTQAAAEAAAPLAHMQRRTAVLPCRYLNQQMETNRSQHADSEHGRSEPEPLPGPPSTPRNAEGPPTRGHVDRGAWPHEGGRTGVGLRLLSTSASSRERDGAGGGGGCSSALNSKDLGLNTGDAAIDCKGAFGGQSGDLVVGAVKKEPITAWSEMLGLRCVGTRSTTCEDDT